ncbi:MAG TPA: PQQ-binding-like beta-propeller repeat protein [Terriglobales bacterium]
MLLLVSALLLNAQVSVLTQNNDRARTGQNLQESVLNTSNVSVSSFGKLFTLPVDGYVYAQPLYVPRLSIRGGVHNVVYVVTEHNSVYAFDADTAGSPLWQVNLGPPVPSDDVCVAVGQPAGCADLVPVVGITATPVIDPASATMYVVAQNKDPDGTYHFRLHALDLVSGAGKFGGPADVTAPGFLPFNHLNRPGLLLLNGVVYFAFGSVGDFVPWHGWVMAYDARTLQQIAVFNPTPDNTYMPGGGVWQAGKGLVSDEKFVYLITSNGNFNVNTGGNNYGSTFLKLTTPNLKVADYFAPWNQSFLNLSPGNVDLGAGGPILLPGTEPPVVVGGGKEGVLYVLDAANMGQFNPTFNSNLQDFQATHSYPHGMLMGGPVFWNGPRLGAVIYLWGPGDVIKAWRLVGRTFQTTPVAQGNIANPPGYTNLSPLSISSNGSQAGTGIIWASRSLTGTGKDQSGVLTALDASELTRELWNSRQNAARDDVGKYARFTPPTVANGKVYLSSFVGPEIAGQDSGQVHVYGLLIPPDFRLGISPSAANISAGQSAVFTTTLAAQPGFTGTVFLNVANCPPRATCTFNPPSLAPGNSSSQFTIATSAPTVAAVAPGEGRASPSYVLLLPLAGLVHLRAGRMRRKHPMVLLLLCAAVISLLLFQLGCGGGASSNGQTRTGGTPAGTYTLSIISNSGSLQHSTPVTLTVQ